MKYTLLDRDGGEIQIQDIGGDFEGRAMLLIEGVLTVGQLVALAHYLAKNHCPESLREAEDDARTMHEWWNDSDQFKIMEEA